MKLKLTAMAVTAVLSAGVSVIAQAATASPDSFTPPASDRTTWFNAGADKVVSNAAIVNNKAVAKNVILFVGDGMGISTITAARILAGQQPNLIGSNPTATASSGEENSLSFELFPNLALSKTYSANQQTPDSAPTMTAMVTGVKTLDGVLSLDEAVTRGDCATDISAHKLPTILEMAESYGKSTGLVSTARITHATPAANYAHTPERNWEGNQNLPNGCAVPDIARQLIEFSTGNGIDVVFGGGRDYFRTNTQVDPEYAESKGKRTDGRDLTAEWVTKYGAGSSFIYKKSEFDAIDTSSTKHVLGLFERSHMQYEADRPNDTAGEPSLADMTQKSIEILKNNPKGFYLHVEGGRIDHGHHAGNAYRALTDAMALSDAVKRAVDTLQTNGKLDETLIIVTADHSHVFTIGGYPKRGNNILGKVIDPGKVTYTNASDGHPYTTLSYANGLGYHVGVNNDKYGNEQVYSAGVQVGRVADMTSVDTTDVGFHQEATVPLAGGETHAGEDVAIFARGPGAYLIRGSLEQNVIFHVMNKKMSKR